MNVFCKIHIASQSNKLALQPFYHAQYFCNALSKRFTASLSAKARFSVPYYVTIYLLSNATLE